MSKKFKLTGFARLFIFLIFLAPIAYIGASYYNGEDGIENIKNLFGIGEEKVEQTDTADNTPTKEVSNEFINGKIERLESDNEKLEQENNKLHLEIESLKKELEQAQQETEHVKGQLKAIKDAVGG